MITRRPCDCLPNGGLGGFCSCPPKTHRSVPIVSIPSVAIPAAPTQQGWQCPKCSAIWSPFTLECYRCNKCSS